MLTRSQRRRGRGGGGGGGLQQRVQVERQQRLVLRVLLRQRSQQPLDLSSRDGTAAILRSAMLLPLQLHRRIAYRLSRLTCVLSCAFSLVVAVLCSFTCL